VGEKKTEEVKITVIDYDKESFEEKTVKKPEECTQFKDKESNTWINIDGLHNIEIIEKIGEIFDMHPLILEDIVNTGQRPKIEDFENYTFLLIKMLYVEEEEIKAEQVSIIVGKNFVISFQEKPGDVFNSIRERIKKAKGRIRKMGSGYLTYTLIDAVVDNYFIILEKIGERIEDTEEEVVGDPIPKTLQNIHNFKQELIFLRKSIWPLREVISGLQRSESKFFQKNISIYVRDVYDHTIQVIDTLETYRDIVSGMIDIYLSSVSNKMNEVMKVLTIFAAIFIPLTFIAGIYGMNFNPDISPFNMPELNWYLGYPAALIVMLAVGLALVYYFRRKEWL
ncbi:MAG: magnesium/cobalt transporter CorA, partial [Candidatus Thermoplasmatota archaeon]